MIGTSPNVQILGYGLAAVAYLLLTLTIVVRYRTRLHVGLLTLALLGTSVWALVLSGRALFSDQSIFVALLAEFFFDAVWLMLLGALLAGAVGAGGNRLVRFGGLTLATVLLGIGSIQHFVAAATNTESGAVRTLVIGSILTALCALVMIEQIYRNSRESQRRALKYICLGVAVIFAYDLLMYSNAALNVELEPVLWSARGFVVAMIAPLILIAIRRSTSTSVGIFVSRQVVFYSATLVGAGIYLTLVGFAGFYLRVVGGEWGGVVQVLLFAAATIGLFVFLFSDLTRARLRVFISKHFFENKYDYREEWLRLIQTLTSDIDGLPLKKRAIKALAGILESDSGVLWTQARDSDDFICSAGWNARCGNKAIPADCPIAAFMRRSHWVIDLEEYRADPSHYDDIEIDTTVFDLGLAGYVVPLFHESALTGFVVLSVPVTQPRLNYEDRDLLKTAGQQIASYLAQEKATEQLAESRQFEAFNRLTAYLMHDLKNVVAQQMLVVENAEKHRNNPEFIEDAMQTVRGSVRRIRKLIEHIQQNPVDQRLDRVELGKIVMQAVSQCADRQPVPRAIRFDRQVWVRADRDRLLMAVYHAIRNAQDATDPSGTVEVRVTADGKKCHIRIADTGVGMPESFVRERLFKPFDSTKGPQGMGIGAYQLRETIRAIGGEVCVYSRENAGTTIVLELKQQPNSA